MQDNNRLSRHNSRILALQKLFAWDFAQSQKLTSDTSEDLWVDQIKQIDEIEHYDKDFVEQLYLGTIDHIARLDEIVIKLAPERTLENTARVDLQILRLAIFEGFISKITPEKVAINEAIELCKDFSNDQTRKFISGVLGKLIDNKAEFGF